jgi:predicted  nucleic acid-binding Zn-ribbon protein
MMRPLPARAGPESRIPMRTRLAQLVLGAAVLCSAMPGLAQTAPAAKPRAGDSSAATGKVSTLGEAKPGGRLLTREELRACLKQKTELAERKPPLEAERTQLDRERQELQQIDESLKAERASIEKLAETAADIGKRSKELSAQTADFNERAAKLQNANLSGPTAERQRTSLERERIALDKSAQALEAERAALGPAAEQKAKAFDARLALREQAAGDWNARNARLTQAAQGYEIDLQNWSSDCSGRSYREDDEKAILSGK